MAGAGAIAEHWGRGDVYGLIISALAKAGKPLEGLTVEDLAPVDHYHARGFPATVELADRLPIRPGRATTSSTSAAASAARPATSRSGSAAGSAGSTSPSRTCRPPTS